MLPIASKGWTEPAGRVEGGAGQKGRPNKVQAVAIMPATMPSLWRIITPGQAEDGEHEKKVKSSSMRCR